MDDELDDDSVSLGPGGILSGVFIAVMGMAIIYNAVFRQEPSHRVSGDFSDITTKFIEITSVKPPKPQVLKPAGSLHQKSSEPDISVTAVQQELMDLGLFTGPVDGIEGQMTVKAVEDYQRRNGLRVTGHADRQLLDHIHFTRQLAAASGTTDSIAAVVPDERIRTVQLGLSDLGYRPGGIDGYMGDATRQAIRQFQHDKGLPETGEVSDDLIAELKDVSGVSHLD